jgi:hypothetical protein
MPVTELKPWKSRTIAAGANAKTVKGDDTYFTAIMYLAPYTSSGAGNLCATAHIAECHVGCLFRSGRAALFDSVNNARIAKTKRYFASRAAFMQELVRDISAFERRCKALGVKPAVRLNGTSDIPWEIAHPCTRNGVAFKSIFDAFPAVTFYDYTKVPKRVYRQLPANYSLTLSYSGANYAYGEMAMKAAFETGANLAVVFRSKTARDRAMQAPLGTLTQFMGRPILNGDETDMRFLDPLKSIVGLYAKGPAKRDQSGFVVDF